MSVVGECEIFKIFVGRFFFQKIWQMFKVMGIQKNNVIKDSLTNYSVLPIFMSTELKYEFK